MDRVMVVLTVVSVLAAIVSAVAARAANAEAKGANRLAREANEEAAKANRLSIQSNAKAEESNVIASRAQQFAEAVPLDQAWDEAITAVQAMQNFDPNNQRTDAGPYLTNMRTRMLLLVDKVAWDGFDKWVAVELRLDTTLLREGVGLGLDLRRLQGGDLSVDGHLRYMQPFASWVAAFTNNLRMLRRDGWKADEIAALTRHAHKTVAEYHTKYGWEDPPEKVPRNTGPRTLTRAPVGQRQWRAGDVWVDEDACDSAGWRGGQGQIGVWVGPAGTDGPPLRG